MNSAPRAAHRVPSDLWNPIRVEDENGYDRPKMMKFAVSDRWDEQMKRRGVCKIMQRSGRLCSCIYLR